MSCKIALVGNPNSGKSTLFNALTNGCEYIGNWPGITVEKKIGKVRDSDNVLIDLPGIYSLGILNREDCYSEEELVSRRYLLEDSPDIILNIIDGTCIERSLYLTLQLMELDIPMI
ncbi:MAG: ferrous iron transporter B, partial [Clostridiales bacterium]|nr:ferrous iron transporter B [Clostridiales bacterium]